MKAVRIAIAFIGGSLLVCLVLSSWHGYSWAYEQLLRPKREHVVIADCAPGADVMVEGIQGMGPPMFWCEAVEMNGRTVHVRRRFPDDAQPMRISFPGRKRMRIVVEEAD